VDKASVGIPILYVATAFELAQALQATGDSAAAAARYAREGDALARVAGIR
jgi:hypothetical protein